MTDYVNQLYEAYGYQMESDATLRAAVRHLQTHPEDIRAWQRAHREARRHGKVLRVLLRGYPYGIDVTGITANPAIIMYTHVHDDYLFHQYSVNLESLLIRHITRIAVVDRQ